MSSTQAPEIGAPPLRYPALDALRAIAMLGGIVLHAAVPYMRQRMPSLLWPVYEPSQHLAYDAIFWWLHSFRIPMFFMIAGFFGALLVQRRGPEGFLVHRVRRILVPYCLAVVIILPITYYVFCAGWWLSDRATLHEILRWRFYDDSIDSQLSGPAHLWFLADLFIICVAYWIWARWRGRASSTRVLDALLLGPWRVFVLAVPSAVLVAIDPDIIYRFDNTFIPDPVSLGYHGTFFFTGVWMYRHRDDLTRFGRGSWLHLALGTAAFGGAMGVWTRPEEDPWLLGLLTALTAWAYTFGFLGVFQRVFAHPSPAWRFVSDSSYWLYLVHLPVVAGLQVLLRDVPVPAAVKFAVTIGVTTLVGLLTYRAFVRYTFVGTWLNGQRIRQPSIE